MDIKIILLIVVLIFCLHKTTEGLGTVTVKDHFKNLMNDFETIFPKNNRNAGGVQFYHHIHYHKHLLTKELFMLYNTYYCGVSGSPVDPKRGNTYDIIEVSNHENTKKYVGKYYRCCWPCLCDVMKYAKAEKFTVDLPDGPCEHIVLVIDDPCYKEDKIPDEVSSFDCRDKQTLNGIRSNSGRLIFAVLHEHTEYDNDNEYSEEHKVNLKKVKDKCRERMDTGPDDLMGGMGDIFAKLASI
jgi:hypothetical protein